MVGGLDVASSHFMGEFSPRFRAPCLGCGSRAKHRRWENYRPGVGNGGIIVANNFAGSNLFDILYPLCDP